MEDLDTTSKLYETAITLATEYGLQVIGAIVVLFVGGVGAGFAKRTVIRVLDRRGFDVTLSRLLAAGVRWTVLGFAIIVALGKFGISISPLLAAVGGAIFGATFALQGPLSNIASGIVIVITRPYVVGDAIEVAGAVGVVERVSLSTTVLRDEDGVSVMVPNKLVVGTVVRNAKEQRIVEAEVGVSYGADIASAIDCILQVLERRDDVVSEPAPDVGVASFGASAVVIAYRYWIPTGGYFQASYDINAEIFSALREAGVDIPFPQREVRMIASA